MHTDPHYTAGWANYCKGEFAQAEAEFHLGVGHARQKNDPAHLSHWLDQLAMAVLDGGDPVRAESLLHEALALVRRLPADPQVDSIRHDLLRVLASAQQQRGHYHEAAATSRELLASQRSILDRDHPDVAATLYSFASCEQQAGNLALAEAMHREALDLRQLPGRSDPSVILSQIAVAQCLIDHGAFDEAKSLLHYAGYALRVDTKMNALVSWSSLGSLATAWSQYGNLPLAERLARELLAVALRKFNPHHLFVGLSYRRLADVLGKRGDREAAEPEYRQALAIMAHIFGRKGRHFPSTLEAQARLRKDQSRYDEAEVLGRDALAARRATAGEDNAYVLPSLEILAQVQAARGHLGAAIIMNRRHLAICRGHLGARHPETATSLVALAAALVRQGEFQAAADSLAEAWLIEQALGYLRREPQRHLHRGYEQLYTAWTKTDPAKAPLLADWQEKLLAFDRIAQP